MQLVRPTGRWNCGSACLAMVLNMTVEDVEKQLLRRRVGDLVDPQIDGPGGVIGVTSYEISHALWSRGVLHRMCAFVSADGESDITWLDRVGPQMFAHDIRELEAHLMADGVAILAVDSLRHEGGSHWIVAKGTRLLDPAPEGGPVYSDLWSHLDKFQGSGRLEVAEAFMIQRSPKIHRS